MDIYNNSFTFRSLLIYLRDNLCSTLKVNILLISFSFSVDTCVCLSVHCTESLSFWLYPDLSLREALTKTEEGGTISVGCLQMTFDLCTLSTRDKVNGFIDGIDAYGRRG